MNHIGDSRGRFIKKDKEASSQPRKFKSKSQTFGELEKIEK
jgi:hypothetical protein